MVGPSWRSGIILFLFKARRSELQQALIRENMVRLEARQQEGVLPSSICDATLLQPALTKHKISEYPTQKSKPMVVERLSRFNSESSADYIKRMHADYYVKAESSLLDAVTSEQDHKYHQDQKSRLMNSARVGAIELIEDNNAGQHAPWSSPLAEQQKERESGRCAIGLRPLEVIHARVGQLSDTLRSESAREQAKPQHLESISGPTTILAPLHAEKNSLAPLQQARLKVEALNSEMGSESFVQILQSEQTITWKESVPEAELPGVQFEQAALDGKAHSAWRTVKGNIKMASHISETAKLWEQACPRRLSEEGNF